MNHSRNFKTIAFCLSTLFVLVACKKSQDSIQVKTITFKNKIAYIFSEDSTDAVTYKNLLQANNCGVTLFDMAQTGNIDFKKFDLMVIGNNAAQDAYEFSAITGPIKSSGKPVLQIGEGGAHFGEMINAAVNWGSCASFPFPATITVVDSSMSIFKSPKKIPVPANFQIPIFNQAPFGQAFEKSIYLNYPTVELIAQASSINSNAFSVTLESGKYGFFGYYNNINAMTQVGKDFMVNLSYYVGKLSL